MLAMAKDIVPELLEKIEADFARRISTSETVARVGKLINEGKATYKEANEYAIEVGQILADVFKANLSSEVLPDGRMYYNIAERVLNKTLGHNHELIADVCAKVQTDLNQVAGIGLKGIKPELNQDRIDGLIERVSAEERYDDVAWALDEPVINFSQAVVDDSAKANIDFHARSGLSPKVIRRSTGTCCDWCNEVAGEYSYPNVPKDVFRRHRFCKCTIEYYPGDGRKQNVHSKAWQKINEQERTERIERLSKPEEKFANATPAQFSRALVEAMKNVLEEKRWRVTAYDPDHYVGSKLHVTEAGSTAAVDASGDIFSVCRRMDDNVRGTDLVKEAIRNGGVKLDSYSGNHVFYIKNGFEPISWCEWDDEFKPPDWREEYGREPIIFYRYTGKVPEEIEAATDFFNRVPLSSDYPSAQKVRDDLIGDK